MSILLLPGDLAGEQTLLMSPKHFREFVKPYEREIVEHSHRRGLKIVKHSDGNMWPILDDIMDMGFDGFHPIQPQCMDIGEVKRHVAGKVCLLGNIDCRDLLPFGTEEEVDKSVKNSKAAPGEGTSSVSPTPFTLPVKLRITSPWSKQPANTEAIDSLAEAKWRGAGKEMK